MSFRANPKINGSYTGSPYDNSNLCGKYFLTHVTPLFKKSHKKPLEVEDLGPPPRVDFSRTLGLRLQQNYNHELLNRKKPSFLRAVIKTFGPHLLVLSILDFFSKCIAYPMQTIALGWLIRDAGLYLNFSQVAQQQQALAATVDPLATTTNVTVAPVISPVAADAITGALTEDQAYWNVICDAIMLLAFTILAIILAHPFFFQTYHLGMQCRVAACYLVYKKSLRLSQSAMSQTTVGQMVNLLTNDVNRFDQAAQMTPYLVLAPLQATVVLTLLSLFYLGVYPTLATLAALVVYVFIQSIMGRGFSKFRSKTARRTDERVRLMNEIILAIKIIKMYAWEKSFRVLVHSSRRNEIIAIGIASVLKTINQTLFFVSSKIIVFVGLMVYVLLGYSFNPEVVFVSIGLANLIRVSLTLFFPNAIAYCAETIISCSRINTFLNLPEIELAPSTYKASSDGLGCKYAVSMKNVSASWTSKEEETAAAAAAAAPDDSRMIIIRNLSFSVRPRDLVLIVGRVGSGKSSVLMSLLGELPIASGRVEINGRVSFASQDAWIFAGTVRDNILFGKPYKAARYKEVIEVCSLERDMSILIDGDQTIVGERGVSLSGGQKARVNLARALYQDADIYLLDDPLSAVDAPVAKHIFNQSLRTFLRKKTVILATHQLQFLRHATKVLVVDRDLPAAYGTLQEVIQSQAFSEVNYGKQAFEDATTTEAGTDVELSRDECKSGARRGRGSSRDSSKSSAHSESPTTSKSSSESPAKLISEAVEDSERLIRAASQASDNLNSSVRVITPLLDKSKDSQFEGADETPAEQKLMMKKKTKNQGNSNREGREILSEISSNFHTYFYYLSNATGLLMFIWFVLVNLSVQFLYQYTDLFLSYWTDSVQRQEYQGADFVAQTFVDELTTSEISSVYGVLIALLFVCALLRSATFYSGCLRGSIRIHDRLFNSIVQAPMRFFDFSPIGILLNRLSRDIGFVDEILPLTAADIIMIFTNISGILVMAVFLNVYNLIACMVLLTLVLGMRAYCAKTITRLKQIEGVTRSPVFSHLSTTLSGLATIRAFRVQDEFVQIFDQFQDRHTSSWFNYISAGRWLAVSLDWLNISFVAMVMTLMLALQLNSSNASTIGLLISQIVVLPGPFQWGVRQLIELESQMTSVQRIKEFSELESEEQLMKVRPRADSAHDHDDDHDDADHQASGGRWRAARDKSDNLLASYQSGRLMTPGAESPDDEGELRFVDVSLSYFHDEPPVLKKLNFTIKSGEKVGVVGRTGAGKSSIVSILFRLYDFSGTIEIDGRDTKTMQLNELRERMSIIPQEPVLFGGTLRKNLDPFGKYSDRQLWEALEAVQLRHVFARTAQGLNYLINEGGSNFSVGQRQLICLARAIIRRNKILVLDEATANVDPETDAFIQRAIGQQFGHCTLLTIAHRLITIVDTDRVLVLDAGEVREFGEPYELLRTGSSLFAQMVESSGQQAARLRQMIEEAHRRRVGLANGAGAGTGTSDDPTPSSSSSHSPSPAD